MIETVTRFAKYTDRSNGPFLPKTTPNSLPIRNPNPDVPGIGRYGSQDGVFQEGSHYWQFWKKIP